MMLKINEKTLLEVKYKKVGKNSLDLKDLQLSHDSRFQERKKVETRRTSG